MKKIIISCCILILTFLAAKMQGQSITGYSQLFTFDTKTPVVSVLGPNGGESYDAKQAIPITWSAVDEQMGVSPISFAIRTTENGGFQTLLQNQINDGNQNVQPPFVSTQFGVIQVSAKDKFGNIGIDTSNAYFSLINGGVAVSIAVTASQSGSAITGASITALSAKGQFNALPTQVPGQYILHVPQGYGYKLTITAEGYQTANFENLTFSSSGSNILNYQLLAENNFSNYRIVPVALAPNPSILEIPEGGIGYAWFVVEGLKNGVWLPVPEITITSQDGQGNAIESKTGFLSYSFLSSIYHIQNAGVFSVKIPSSIIGNGNPNATETFTVNKVNGVLLPPENQQSIIAKVKSYTYTTSWDYRIYGKGGLGLTSGFATATGFIGGGSGSSMKIHFSGLSQNPTWSIFEISRRSDLFEGADFSLGAPNIIPFVDIGYKNEVKASFPIQKDYSFDMNNLQGLESLMAFYLFYEPAVVFAGKTFSPLSFGASFLNWMAEALIANSAQNGLGLSRFAQEIGLDLSKTQELGVSFGPTEPNSFGLSFGPSLGTETHIGSSLRKTVTNEIEKRLYLSGKFSANLSIGPKWIGENDSKASAIYPFRLTKQIVPSEFGVEAEGICSFENNSFNSFKLSAGIESNALGLNLYNLSGQKQKYTSWLLADNEYVKNLLYNCTEIPSEIANIGSSAVHIATHSNTLSDATTSFLSAIYDEQNNDLPTRLGYGVDGQANSVYDMHFDLPIPIPTCPPVVFKIGGGIEAAQTSEYEISKGYWVKALPYLQTEMPNPPNPQVSFNQAIITLWDNVISVQTFVALKQVILSHLKNKIFHRQSSGKSSSYQTFYLNDEGSELQLNSASIPTELDSIYCNHWKWDENNSGKSLTTDKQKIVKDYIKGIKSLRQTASGVGYGIGGFFSFEPKGYDFGDSTLIKIRYQDSDVIDINEASLAVFEEDTLGIWHYLPSTPTPDSNYVTAYVHHFLTYSVAPILPSGDYGLHATPDSIASDGFSIATIISDTLRNADSSIIHDHILFTVSSSRGTIIAADADTALAGIQISSMNGLIGFQIKADTVANPISVFCTSTIGFAKCQAEIVLFDTIPPPAPEIISAVPNENSILVKWKESLGKDISNYKVYFDTDTIVPPYTGVASVWGSNSPISIGLTNEFEITGLTNDSTYFIALTAVDISGNESNYSLPVVVSPMRDKKVQLSFLLEGLYNQEMNSMNKAKSESGYAFSDSIADLIKVELRDAVNPDSIVLNLNKNVSTNGSSTFNMQGRYAGNYYIVIQHRNSIETWSASPVSFNSDTVTYNFTDANSKAFGNNLKAINGKHLIYSGDVNQDGFINPGDIILVTTDSGEFVTGYVATDVNGDGVIDALDMILIDNNASNYIEMKKP